VIESLTIAVAIAAAVAYLIIRAVRKSRQRADQNACAGCHCIKKP
jgi:hypothetical protein